MSIYQQICNNQKHLAILIDPDKYTREYIENLFGNFDDTFLSFILVGGSHVTVNIESTILSIREFSKKPIILFPGSVMQLTNSADGILLLSLLSGRNPEYLIGNHVHAAPFLKRSKLEIIPTAYLLIDGGRRTSVEYMSNTQAIPADKTELALATALAGEMLGMKLIYLEAGSGAQNSVPIDMIRTIKESINIPIVVGGGIRSESTMLEIFRAGASLVVIGSAIENNPKVGKNFSDCLRKLRQENL